MWRALSPPRRLLIVRNDRVGDLLLTLPALEAARRHWPNAWISVLASKVAAPILVNYPAVDEVLVDDPTTDARRLGDRLRAERYDTAIIAHTTWRNLWGATWAGIEQRIGWGGKLPGIFLSTHPVYVSRSKPPLHEADFVMRLMQRLGVQGEAQDYPVHLPIDPESQTQIAAKIEAQLGTAGPLFGVNPSHFKGAYNWPVYRYAELIQKLSQHGRVIVTVGPNETAVLDQLKQHWAEVGGTDLVKALEARVAMFSSFSLRELAAAISLVDVFTVGNTGPMHLAGVVGTPLVALFSTHPSQSPDRWRPLGKNRVMLQPVLGFEEPRNVEPDQAEQHMCRISVNQVVDANLVWLKWHPRQAHVTPEAQAIVPFSGTNPANRHAA